MYSLRPQWSRASDVTDYDLAIDIQETDQLTDDNTSLVPASTQTSQAPLVQTTSNTSNVIVYKVYKRRWFGLIQLVLLNLIVSWDWLSFSPVSKTASLYFKVTESSINWLSTAFLFAFGVAAPAVVYTLNRGGPKPAIIICAIFILVGNWVRYVGTKVGQFSVVMAGQILIGLAQPFVLAAPTRYSNLWFTDRGRISVTAFASLANPFGGAVGQLVNPFWASEPRGIPTMVLWVAVISSVACAPAFFIPAFPPSPPSANSAHPRSSQSRSKPHSLSLRSSLSVLFRSPEFYVIFLPFSIYVGFFESLSSVLNQVLEPYGYTENQAGIAGAVLILVGLVSAAIISPLADRYKFSVLLIKILVPLIGICYLVFIWAPASQTLLYPYLVLGILGAASFALVPVVLEYLVESLNTLSPEISSTVCWTGGQLMGGIFIIISDALKDNVGTGGPKGNMLRALIFQAALALAIAPLPVLGLRSSRSGARIKGLRLRLVGKGRNVVT